VALVFSLGLLHSQILSLEASLLKGLAGQTGDECDRPGAATAEKWSPPELHRPTAPLLGVTVFQRSPADGLTSGHFGFLFANTRPLAAIFLSDRFLDSEKMSK
jgi:hypothetical protein